MEKTGLSVWGQPALKETGERHQLLWLRTDTKIRTTRELGCEESTPQTPNCKTEPEEDSGMMGNTEEVGGWGVVCLHQTKEPRPLSRHVGLKDPF